MTEGLGAGGQSGGGSAPSVAPVDLAVEVSALAKSFGSLKVVDGVDLTVPRGCAYGYLGPNGAGKTTLIRCLLGLIRADAGSMRILGFEVPRHRARALARVGAIVDEPRFHPFLTGRENLRCIAAARGHDALRRLDGTLEWVGLAGRSGDKVAKYSLGMRQRLGLAACMLADPDLLLLDEPMNGLDPAGMNDMRGFIRELVDEGRTVVLSSHLLDEVEKTCDAVAIVDRGRIVVQGAIDEVIRGPGEVVEVGCDDLPRARDIAASHPSVTSANVEAGLVRVVLDGALPAEKVRGELNRQLVEAGVTVHSLVVARVSLEEKFLSVTSRLGS